MLNIGAKCLEKEDVAMLKQISTAIFLDFFFFVIKAFGRKLTFFLSIPVNVLESDRPLSNELLNLFFPFLLLSLSS